jgi:hypothetical protein
LLRQLSDNRASSIFQQSSVKLVDPALEPYFKPLDDVITLADIEEQLELASQEEKVPLYLEPLYLGD